MNTVEVETKVSVGRNKRSKKYAKPNSYKQNDIEMLCGVLKRKSMNLLEIQSLLGYRNKVTRDVITSKVVQWCMETNNNHLVSVLYNNITVRTGRGRANEFGAKAYQSPGGVKSIKISGWRLDELSEELGFTIQNGDEFSVTVSKAAGSNVLVLRKQ